MDLPNGKALSVEDLKKFLKHHHDGFAKKARAPHLPGLLHTPQAADCCTPAGEGGA
jgi:hypothetical protein